MALQLADKPGTHPGNDHGENGSDENTHDKSPNESRPVQRCSNFHFHSEDLLQDTVDSQSETVVEQ